MHSKFVISAQKKKKFKWATEHSKSGTVGVAYLALQKYCGASPSSLFFWIAQLLHFNGERKL
jgi:hypothetical protein